MFHAIILPGLDVYGIYFTLLYHFGTNLLTEGPVQIVVFAYFSVSQKRNIKWNETFGRVIFGTNVIQGTWSGRQETNEEATRQGARLPPGRALHPRGSLVAPPTYFFMNGSMFKHDGLGIAYFSIDILKDMVTC